ncbi:LicD family protein [Fusobacterium nucleatum]|uniref:LicD family protein n=1 Tax=Fusobacterium nucleatum TaxID=851 RepID=UPI0030CAA7F4
MVKKPFNSIRSYFFRKNVLKTFQKLLSVLEEEKIEAFLVFGTLLGAIREKGFIKHDLDLDFGVWEDNDFLKLRECLEAKGFYLKSEIILLDDETIEHQNYRDKETNISIDFYRFTRLDSKNIYYDFLREENLSYTESIKKNGGLFVYRYDFEKFSLEDYLFKGKKCKIIKEYDDFLKKVYGDTYMIPIKNLDTYNISKKQCYIANKIGKLVYYKK